MDNNIEAGCGKTHGSARCIDGNLLSYFFWCGILIFSLNAYSEQISPDYKLLEVNGYIKIMSNLQRGGFDYGYPDIPVKRILNSSLVNITLTNIDSIKLSHPLYPKQMPKQKNNVVENGFSYDKTAYNSPEPFIGKDYKSEDDYIEVYPFDYIPSETLLIVKTYDIEYEHINEKSSFENNIEIIYHSTFEQSIDSLLNIYHLRGYKINAVSIADIGTNTDSIKEYIKNRYITNPFAFLILIGSKDKIPLFIGTGSDFPYTDLYYSLMDTVDYFPDFTLTRLPFDTESELVDFLEKVKIEYSSNRLNYNGNAYFIATDDGGYHSLVESSHVYSMNVFRQNDYVCDSFYGYYNSGTPISESVNDKKGLVVYSGHGATDYWAGPNYYSSDIESLKNMPYFPIIFSFACLTGNYYYNGFLGNLWLKQSEKGATSFIGSSKETYWEEDDILQRNITDSLMNNGYVADLFNRAKKGIYEYWGNSNMTLGYFERYNYFMLPDVYWGNRKISNHYIYADKYETASENAIDIEIGFEGSLDKSIYLGLYSSSLILNDSNYISNAGIYKLNHNIPSGEDIIISEWIPGALQNKINVTLVDDGPCASLLNCYLRDFVADTFYFDIIVKNYGNTAAESVNTFVKGLPPYFTLISGNHNLGRIEAESSKTIENGFTIFLSGYVDSLESSVCSIAVANIGDTLYENVELSMFSPNFLTGYMYAVMDEDTLSEIILNANQQIVFSIKNLSLLKLKNVNVKLISDGFYNKDSVKVIDVFESAQTVNLPFEVYAYNGTSSEINMKLIVTLGNYTDTISYSIKTKFTNSLMYYGPEEGYYIYSSDMKNLENAPKHDIIDIDSFDFVQLNISDDTTLSLHLPFSFKFGNYESEYLFLNTNGILSLDSLSDNLYQSEPLPSSVILFPSLMFGWVDYRPSYFSDVFFSNSEITNSILQYFDESKYQYILYYNKVNLGSYETYTFAVCIDTEDIVVHFYDIPENSRQVLGIQFDELSALSVTGDSFYDQKGQEIIRSGVSFRFTKESPLLIDKFTETYKKEYDKSAIFGNTFIRNKSEIAVLINENGDYEIDSYNILGSRTSHLYSGFLSSDMHKFSLNVERGINFIIIRNKEGIVCRRKFIIL